MRTILAVFLAAGLAATSFAQDSASQGQPAQTQPQTQPAQAQPQGQPADAAPMALPEPPQVPAIPVPDMPIVKRTELPGGIIAEDMKIGEGYEVPQHGVVVAHYHGTLKEGGKVFDSSFQRGEPIAFPLDGVIKGWQDGVPGMKVGGIRRLTIPAALGYGDQGAGEAIPPKADLVFVIQLVDALQIIDEKVGEGEPAALQCLPATAHTVTGTDGKEIEKVDAKTPYIWLPGEWEPIQFGVVGMKVGGKRKLIVPKEMNQTPPQLQSARPSNVPVTVELELVGLRNLPRR
jgi:FKBP-type peptidyl-prolyl cis-trans isomerase